MLLLRWLDVVFHELQASTRCKYIRIIRSCTRWQWPWLAEKGGRAESFPPFGESKLKLTLTKKSTSSIKKSP